MSNFGEDTSFAKNGKVDCDSVQFYRREGFIIFKGVFSGSWCDRILRIYEKAADETYGTVLNLDRTNNDILSVLKDPKIVLAIEMLQNAEMVGCQTFFFFKRPGTVYAQQAWNPHQDNSYPQAEPGAYLAVYLPLSNQTKETGSLFLYPGSHLDGLLPFEPHTGHREDPNSNPGNHCQVPERCQSRKTDVSLSKGDLLIFDGNLVHGSYPNTTKDQSRPSLVINYIKKGADFIEGRTAKRLKISLR